MLQLQTVFLLDRTRQIATDILDARGLVFFEIEGSETPDPIQEVWCSVAIQLVGELHSILGP